MEHIYFSFPGNEVLTTTLALNDNASIGLAEIRRFPDGESYIRIKSDVCGKHVVLVCTLDKPDEKIMQIYFFSKIVRTMKASTLTLVSPYLSYMRQDKLFHEGEGVTSIEFAKLLSSMVDQLITVDPHLHRFHSLKELYSINTKVVSAAKPIAEWIKSHVKKPFIIGPDSESEQWVKSVAMHYYVPYTFLNKIRLGDKQVEISIPEDLDLSERTPVLVDDIISSGRTMTEILKQLKKSGAQAPVCIGVHGIFAGNAYVELKNAGASVIVTTNTIPHPSNQIDISDLLKF
ncbi:ribose-phosphate pyrophosphokinase [Aurantibacillus circumpalustris]|uniref:ribose-phosphate pyrophosphokinase n=1 Tax=Aurantibacillus circumpalustris TaxID=3036359 RepID=UPI00295B2304|nr:ribose-phosphate pyrophosphokinase [Aurantibacillus circumpalustris]